MYLAHIIVLLNIPTFAIAMNVSSTCLCGLIKLCSQNHFFVHATLCSPSKHVIEAGTGFCLGAMAGLIWHWWALKHLSVNSSVLATASLCTLKDVHSNCSLSECSISIWENSCVRREEKKYGERERERANPSFDLVHSCGPFLFQVLNWNLSCAWSGSQLASIVQFITTSLPGLSLCTHTTPNIISIASYSHTIPCTISIYVYTKVYNKVHCGLYSI